MPGRLILDPNKSFSDMTPAERLAVALRNGDEPPDTAATQLAAEQASDANNLAQQGRIYGVLDASQGGRLNYDVPGAMAYDKGLQDTAQAKQVNLLEAIKSLQANRLQKEGLKKQEEQLQLSRQQLAREMQQFWLTFGAGRTDVGQALRERAAPEVQELANDRDDLNVLNEALGKAHIPQTGKVGNEAVKYLGGLIQTPEGAKVRQALIRQQQRAIQSAAGKGSIGGLSALEQGKAIEAAGLDPSLNDAALKSGIATAVKHYKTHLGAFRNTFGPLAGSMEENVGSLDVAEPKSTHPQASAAEAWAKDPANAKDPRAKEILKRLSK